MIYLDNAATTFPKPECVYSAVDDAQRNFGVNVSRGSYRIATEAMKMVDETRLLLANLVHANEAECVVFSPSATIAANQIIHGLQWDKFKNVYISPFEHNSFARPLETIRSKHDVSIIQLPFISESHELDKDKMEILFASTPPDFVFLNHCSNVTGTVIPVRYIALKAKNYNATVVIDGAQSVGIFDYDLKNDPYDYLIFAGHKNLYSSWGIGGFIKNSSYPLLPFLAGGTGSHSLSLNMSASVPEGFEIGSPNIIAIASLNASLKWLNKVGLRTISEKKDSLMKDLIAGLQKTTVKLYLPGDKTTHTSVLSLNLPDYEPSEVGIILNQDYDIAVRTGFHCAPYIHDFLSTRDCNGTVRISISFFNSQDDINAVLQALSEI